MQVVVEGLIVIIELVVDGVSAIMESIMMGVVGDGEESRLLDHSD